MIKINKAVIEKGETETLFKEGKFINEIRLNGFLDVQMSEGEIIGYTQVKMNHVSQMLQNELYKVLNKIEDELNGIGTDEAPKEGSINITLNISNMSGDANEIEKFSKKIADALKRNQGIR